MGVDLGKVLSLGVLLLAGCERRASAPDPALKVVWATPQSGERLFLNQEIRVGFSTEIDPLSVNASTVRVLDERGNSVPGRRRIQTRSVIFEPVPPLSPDLSDGSFLLDRVYRLEVASFPLSNTVLSDSGRILMEGISRQFRTVPAQPEGYPSPLLSPGLGIEPFRVRVDGALSKQVAAGSGKLRIQFSLPVLPTSLSPEGFEVMILRREASELEAMPLRSVRLLSLPEPIDRYPGSTVELVLGDLDLVEGDLVAVSLTQGSNGLRDYRGRELEPIPIPLWTVVEGDRIPLAEWPEGEEAFEPREWGLPSFAWSADGILQPRVAVEAGAGGLGTFRPRRDTLLAPGVPFDRGDGVLVESQGGQFEFLAVDIPPGVTVRVVGPDPVRILSCGSIRIAGTLDLQTPRISTVYTNGDEVECSVLLRESGLTLLAAGEILVTGTVVHTGTGAGPTALTMIAGAGTDLRGPIPPHTMLADASGRPPTGAAENPIHVLTSITQGLPPGLALQVEASSSWRSIPAAHLGPVHVEVEPDISQIGMEVLVQVAPPDPLDPSNPDQRTQVLEQPRPLPIDSLDVPPGGFVRFLLRAEVRAGESLPAIRRVQLVGN